MAIRSAPIRELQLDAKYSENNGPGVRAYTFGRLAKGDTVKEIVDRFAQEHSIVVPAPTLYEWLRRWRHEAKQAREAKKSVSKPGRKRQAARPDADSEPEGAVA